MAKPSKRQLDIEARMASDPIAQAVGREDIDYTDPDQLPTAPRVNYRGTPRQLSPNPDPNAPMDEPEPDHNLIWGEHLRDGSTHTEWHAPCGCAYHPNPFPHVHPCSDEHKRPDLHGAAESKG